MIYTKEFNNTIEKIKTIKKDQTVYCIISCLNPIHSILTTQATKKTIHSSYVCTMHILCVKLFNHF